MGFKTSKDTITVPTVSHSDTSRPISVNNGNIIGLSLLSNDETLKRGTLLGAMRPYWLKTVESEERLRWIKIMIKRGLLVRDLEAFAKHTSEQLRSEESISREEERKILLELMVVKRNDERRNLRELKVERDRVRRWVLKEFGKKKLYDIQVKKLRREMRKRKEEIRKKYDAKIEHLSKIREKDIEQKKKEELSGILEFYKACVVFDKEKMDMIIKENIDDQTIGKVILDEDERNILKLNPKFAIMKYLDEEQMERDVELGLAKLRYEIRNRKEREKDEEYELGESRKRNRN